VKSPAAGCGASSKENALEKPSQQILMEQKEQAAQIADLLSIFP
jgi:hypothetical protein